MRLLCSILDADVKRLETRAQLACLELDEVLAILNDDNVHESGEQKHNQQEENEDEERDEGDDAYDEESEEAGEEVEEAAMAKTLEEDEKDKSELSELKTALNWDVAILVEKTRLEKRWADKVGA